MGDERGRDPVAEITVLGIVPPPRRLVVDVMAALSRRVVAPCRLRTAPSGIEVPHIPGRDQADADRLLASVESLAHEPGQVLVALTSVDIGSPLFAYFFGRARHGGTAVLVSTARLTPAFYGLPEDDDLTVLRTVLEILHELGHVVGLGHCDDFGCLMRFAPTVEAIDNRGVLFCPACSTEAPPSLRRLRTADGALP